MSTDRRLSCLWTGLQLLIRLSIEKENAFEVNDWLLFLSLDSERNGSAEELLLLLLTEKGLSNLTLLISSSFVIVNHIVLVEQISFSEMFAVRVVSDRGLGPPLASSEVAILEHLFLHLGSSVQ